MLSTFLPVIAGLFLFALALLLFRIGARPETTPSIWRQGSLPARIGLVAWWAALLLVVLGLVMAVRA
ncbi:MAG: hypothetical protein ACOY37_06330 [Pseudomonadota bacterium]